MPIVIERLGSSTWSGSSGRGSSGSASVSPIVMSSMPAIATMSPGPARLRGDPLERLGDVELGELHALDGAVEPAPRDVLAALEGARDRRAGARGARRRGRRRGCTRARGAARRLRLRRRHVVADGLEELGEVGRGAVLASARPSPGARSRRGRGTRSGARRRRGPRRAPRPRGRPRWGARRAGRPCSRRRSTGRRRSRVLRRTKRVWGSGPSAASTKRSTPSTIASPRSTSPPKSAWPGVSTMLIVMWCHLTAVFLARIVMPFSRSRSPESMTRSVSASCSPKAPVWRSILSTRVVLPWSTWAMIATFRRFRGRVHGPREASGALGSGRDGGIDARRGALGRRRDRRGALRPAVRAACRARSTSSSTTSTQPGVRPGPDDPRGRRASGAVPVGRDIAATSPSTTQAVDGALARRAVADAGAGARVSVRRCTGVGVAPALQRQLRRPARRTTRRGSRAATRSPLASTSTRWHSPVAHVAASTAHSARTSRGARGEPGPERAASREPARGAVAARVDLLARGVEHAARRPGREASQRRRCRAAGAPPSRSSGTAWRTAPRRARRRRRRAAFGATRRARTPRAARRGPRRGAARVPAARRAGVHEQLDEARGHVGVEPLHRAHRASGDRDRGQPTSTPSASSSGVDVADERGPVGGRERRDAQRRLAGAKRLEQREVGEAERRVALERATSSRRRGRRRTWRRPGRRARGRRVPKRTTPPPASADLLANAERGDHREGSAARRSTSTVAWDATSAASRARASCVEPVERGDEVVVAAGGREREARGAEGVLGHDAAHVEAEQLGDERAAQHRDRPARRGGADDVACREADGPGLGDAEALEDAVVEPRPQAAREPSVDHRTQGGGPPQRTEEVVARGEV